MDSVEKEDKLKELLDYVRGDYNVFYVLGVDRKENYHSRMIADLLNPNGHHRLGNKPLEKFCDILKETEVVEDFRINHEGEFYIKCEQVTTDKRRIDIYIKDQDGKVVIIENKIYAEDQPSQLYDYYKYGVKQVNGELEKLHVFYLSLDEKEPSKTSLTKDGTEEVDVKYLNITYKTHIIKWIKSILEEIEKKPMNTTSLLYLTLLRYKETIKYLANNQLLPLMNTVIGQSFDWNGMARHLKKQFIEKLRKEFKVKLEDNYDLYIRITNDAYIKLQFGNFCCCFMKSKEGRYFNDNLQSIINCMESNKLHYETGRTIHYKEAGKEDRIVKEDLYFFIDKALPENQLATPWNQTSITKIVEKIGELQPEDFEFLLSDKEVYSQNFNQIINTLKEYINIIKRHIQHQATQAEQSEEPLCSEA